MQRFQQGQQQHKEWQSPSPTHQPQCRALCCSLVLVLGFSKRRHRWNPCWWWLELHEEHAQHKPNKAGLLDRIPSSTGTGTITHQIEFALKFHIEIDDCFKSTSPCLWILSVWYSLRQSQGLGPRRKKPKHSLCWAVSLECFSVLPAVPVQVCRDWVSSQDKEDAGLEMLVKRDIHSSLSGCHWFQAWGPLGATAQP